ncbi:MAG: putative spermidine/putrescine transport system permease protein [Rhodospirillaceae bacterium]|jgi:putative spermidine/putrescine transport system permease protein|nr:putative spermidine/putrescine transport system permease protein [Rhodospirillaceae bacterium]MEA2805871.1 putative spermidine/putrescine transport system permease protein [Rhodospirillaceae bacterium]
MSASSLPIIPALSQRRGIPRLVIGFTLLIPALAFLVVFLILPSLLLLSYSVLTQPQSGDIGLPFTLASYERLLFSPAYRRVVILTLRVAFFTSLFTFMLAYPLAMVVAYGRPLFSRVTMILVVAPLVVSVLVRTYGWQLILGNSRTGVLNWLLEALGTGPTPVRVLYTEWATVIASVHVFLPLMVLPLAASLGRINPSLNEAARMLGAPAWRAFVRITLPLSVPGLIAGLTIVFSLTAASYVTPQMLGGNRGTMLGVLLEQQVTTAFDWPMAAAIATVMVAIALSANVGVGWLFERRMAARLRRSGAA